MEITKNSTAGTMESSDIQINLEPRQTEGHEIYLKSAVEKQYGDQIRALISETLRNLGISKCIVRAIDKGALDCTIRARVQTAVNRGCESSELKIVRRLS